MRQVVEKFSENMAKKGGRIIGRKYWYILIAKKKMSKNVTEKRVKKAVEILMKKWLKGLKGEKICENTWFK